MILSLSWIIASSLSTISPFCSIGGALLDVPEACSSSFEKSKGSPLPVISHDILTSASAETFSTTSNEGLPCRLPTILSTTEGVTPIALANALLFPPYKTRIILPKRSFTVIAHILKFLKCGIYFVFCFLFPQMRIIFAACYKTHSGQRYEKATRLTNF